jgi:hypothetical protein
VPVPSAGLDPFGESTAAMEKERSVSRLRLMLSSPVWDYAKMALVPAATS